MDVNITQELSETKPIQNIVLLKFIKYSISYIIQEFIINFLCKFVFNI